MKPTQQEIIELAREAGIVFDERAMPYYERLVHWALERFGAGGGEPVAWMGIGKTVNKPQTLAFSEESAIEYGVNVRAVPRYTHPSTTDLRAEYLRGLEDAAKVCEYVATLYSEAARKHPEDSESRSRTFARSRAASQCVEEIRALLKGKQ